MSSKRIHGLDVIIDPDGCRGRDPVEVARLALEGGGAGLQWRGEGRAAEAAGASYVAVGAVFPTASKEPGRTRPASPERLREGKSAVSVPVVAIGGVDASDV